MDTVSPSMAANPFIMSFGVATFYLIGQSYAQVLGMMRIATRCLE